MQGSTHINETFACDSEEELIWAHSAKEVYVIRKVFVVIQSIV